MEIFWFSVNHRAKAKAMKIRHLLNRPIECFVPVGGGDKGVVYIARTSLRVP